MITITNYWLLLLFGFEPISPRAVVRMSWRMWLGVIRRRLSDLR